MLQLRSTVDFAPNRTILVLSFLPRPHEPLNMVALVVLQHNQAVVVAGNIRCDDVYLVAGFEARLEIKELSIVEIIDVRMEEEEPLFW